MSIYMYIYITAPAHTGVLFEPARSVLITASDDGSCIVWDLRGVCERARRGQTPYTFTAGHTITQGAPHCVLQHVPQPGIALQVQW